MKKVWLWSGVNLIIKVMVSGMEYPREGIQGQKLRLRNQSKRRECWIYGK